MRNHPKFVAYAALAAVCFFWGTTYLGIRMALESFQPFVLVSTRYLLSGSILLIAAWLRGSHIPRGRELWRSALFGTLVLGVGNGCLTVAETWIPSGLAAVMITISPFWLVGIDALLPGGTRLHAPTLAGMAVGLLGTALLVLPSGDAVRTGNTLAGFLVLQLGCLGWTFGSLMQKREPAKAHPIVVGAVQQFAAGAAFLVPALFTWKPIVWTARSTGALVYLVIFGSIVGYSAFIIAMDRLPVSLVSIYNYINPIVAVTLGWLIYSEPFGKREGVAMAIIFLGVGLVKRFAHREEPA